MKNTFNMEITLYQQYLLKPFMALKKLLTTPKGITVSATTYAYIRTLHVENKALIILAIVVIIDFGTGILVSFKKARDQAILEGKYVDKTNPNMNWFGRFLYKIKFYIDVIESGRLRLSLLKTGVYLFIIIFVKTIQMTFKIKPFEFSFSEEKWTITLIIIAVCIAFELHSIIFENAKSLGYDFIDKLFSLFRSYRDVKSEINKE